MRALVSWVLTKTRLFCLYPRITNACLRLGTARLFLKHFLAEKSDP
jgi:hypothetical protein